MKSYHQKEDKLLENIIDLFQRTLSEEQVLQKIFVCNNSRHLCVLLWIEIIISISS